MDGAPGFWFIYTDLLIIYTYLFIYLSIYMFCLLIYIYIYIYIHIYMMHQRREQIYLYIYIHILPITDLFGYYWFWNLATYSTGYDFGFVVCCIWDLWLCHSTIGVHPPNKRLPCLCSDWARLARFYWLLFSPHSGLCFLGKLGPFHRLTAGLNILFHTAGPFHRLLSFIALAGNS